MGIKAKAVWETAKFPIGVLAFLAVLALVLCWAVAHFMSFAIVYGLGMAYLIGDSVYDSYRKNLLKLQMKELLVIDEARNKTIEEDHY